MVIKAKSIVLVLAPVMLLLHAASENQSAYSGLYQEKLEAFKLQQELLLREIEKRPALTAQDIEMLKSQIASARMKMKSIDFWMRYFNPVAYHKINGPLPVEWETEVFEKFEKPYKRTGAGLTLAELYLDEANPQSDTLLSLVAESLDAIRTYEADSTMKLLVSPDHFFFANRLFLLNLAAIYTTGFECPNSGQIIPELQTMLRDVSEIYRAFNQSFPGDTLTGNYLALYNGMESFVSAQSKNPESFDHFHFIRDYVNPLYAMNQRFIINYRAVSRNFNDYSLNNRNVSIFDKDLFKGQNRKGVFIAIDDTAKLNEIKAVGKMLFFDPILSGNGKRSCVSCHNPQQCFTDTAVTAGTEFNSSIPLKRNTPSLVNVLYNHLLMLDGRHFTLQNQGKEVITNPDEMGSNPQQVIAHVMDCAEYRKSFSKFVKWTPSYPEVTLDHIVSALSLYYADFSDFSSPFDRAMNGKESISAEAVRGFNLFMSKAQCATCHFVPQFSGVKPPFINSEFEVLGVPADASYSNLSADSGRFLVNPAEEMLHAFRTPTIRNSGFTKPYMHNGVFRSIDEVIDFYNSGGGAGKGLTVANQTLSPDSLQLTDADKAALKAFLKTLDEDIKPETIPGKLPATKLDVYAGRKVGGEY